MCFCWHISMNFTCQLNPLVIILTNIPYIEMLSLHKISNKLPGTPRLSTSAFIKLLIEPSSFHLPRHPTSSRYYRLLPYALSTRHVLWLTGEQNQEHPFE